MSGAVSPVTGRAYGMARVARVWRLSRATVYRHRAPDGAAAPSGPVRRGPVGACSDAELVDHIRARILGSRLHGEGYRKIWARLRHAGVRTSARRVRRLMGEHGLLVPHRVGRPTERAAWLPTHSLEQWSTATKTRARPSARVTVSVMSVPHMTSTAAVVIVPSWGRAAGRPTRCGASRPCRPIRRRTRRAEVRTPAWRSRARIFL